MNVTDDQCQAALDYLRESDADYAAAKAHRAQLEHSRKHLLYKVARESGGSSAAQRLEIAYASVEYGDFLVGLGDVHREEVTLENRRATAQTVISVWQSLQRRGL